MNLNHKIKANEICFIAPSKYLVENAEKIISENNEHNIGVYLSTVDEVDGLYRELISSGAKIFISRKGVASYLSSKYKANVVNVETSTEDYIRIFEATKDCEGLVALFTYQEVSLDIKAICKILDVNIRPYYYKNNKDCEICVREAIKDGAKMAVGGSVTEKYAKELGLEHVIVESSDDAIISAINVAKKMLKIHKEEEIRQIELKTQLEKYMAILNYSHDSIIVTDQNCNILTINNNASKMIGKHADDHFDMSLSVPILQEEIKEVLESEVPKLNKLININNTLLITNIIPIMVNRDIKGIVATFQDINTIQNNEKKIRMKLAKKGLIAKYKFEDILGQSAEILSAISIAKSYAKENAAVIIRGETGTGKELFAQSIHNASERRNGPFVAVNCAAIAKGLLESELFGYEEGSFTGANKEGKPGFFEMAHGGTIFLDEIGEISRETQVNLLRVLQEKEVRRIGSSEVIPVDIRVITATNKDLEEEVKNNEFRRDLYFRLSVLDVKIPPLRNREGDIAFLGHKFLKEYSKDLSIDFTNDFETVIYMDVIKNYKWYGNVRELQNFVERFFILMKNGYDVLNSSLIGKSLLTNISEDNSNNIDMSSMENRCSIAQKYTYEDGNLERIAIIEALTENNFSVIKTARILSMSRQTLWRKMNKYNIKI